MLSPQIMTGQMTQRETANATKQIASAAYSTPLRGEPMAPNASVPAPELIRGYSAEIKKTSAKKNVSSGTADPLPSPCPMRWARNRRLVSPVGDRRLRIALDASSPDKDAAPGPFSFRASGAA